LTGFYQGEVAGGAANATPGGHETIALPPPPEGVPYYDGFTWSSPTLFVFDHWWVVLIDP
jgi:hypothetical protein